MLSRVLTGLEVLALIAWLLAILFKILSWSGSNEILLYSSIALAVIMMLWRRVHQELAISLAAIAIAVNFLGTAGTLLQSPWGSTVRMAGIFGCGMAALFLIYCLIKKENNKSYLFWLLRVFLYGINPTWLIFIYLAV